MSKPIQYRAADRSDFVPCRNHSRKATSKMTREELARVVAEHRGYYTTSGGWLYTADGRPVCHGYGALARRLDDRIVEGRGIDWQRIQ